ncbi:putative phosphatidate phosphatase [Schistocerca nitens]|uniref:putative phosphatidate phosphatase n=1 Tax=Schistocerca nitens TaxID=7011 RepID=UPI002118CC55|nr:putative phosphatidate phosphatase [Schistocerca nitens]
MRSEPPQKQPCPAPPAAAMAVVRLSLLRVTLEITVILLEGLAVLFIFLFGKPFRRGFFCDDESIRHPVKADTVPSLALALVALGLPLLVVVVTERVVWGARPRSGGGGGGVSLSLCSRRAAVPRWVSRASAAALAFLWGAGAQQLLVDSAKLVVGRLRPHFFTACQPDVNCSALQPPYTYITDYTCLGTDPDVIEEARLSFPSGHSSLSFYAAVFTIIYIGRTGGPWAATLPRHLLQFVLFLAAWCCALSRVSDYMHHWSDVLAGSSIGTATAILTMVFVQPQRRRAPAGPAAGAAEALSEGNVYGSVDGSVPPA